MFYSWEFASCSQKPSHTKPPSRRKNSDRIWTKMRQKSQSETDPAENIITDIMKRAEK